MKTNLLVMLLMLSASDLFPQKLNPTSKWRTSETDTMTVAQAMFDDMNFVMAYPYISALQKNHPEEGFLKYMTGICSLFKEGTQKQGLDLLLDVYQTNKRAEDIEFYIALAFHYNNNFTDAVVYIDKYLARKALTKPQRRSAEKLKEYCNRGEILVAAPDEGNIDDYIAVAEEEK